jgi:hypothetical protein
VPPALLPSSMTKRVRVLIFVSKGAWSAMLGPGRCAGQVRGAGARGWCAWGARQVQAAGRDKKARRLMAAECPLSSQLALSPRGKCPR